MAQSRYTIPLKQSLVALRTDLAAPIDMTAKGLDGDQYTVSFLENVMPTKEGYSSVRLRTASPAAIAAGGDLIVVIKTIQVTFETFRLYLIWRSNGEAYFWSESLEVWAAAAYTDPVLPPLGFTAPTSISEDTITIANLNGQSFIHFSKVGTFEPIQLLTLFLAAVNFSGINAANMLGLTASSGYLIAYDEETVYWSSLIDPTDFTASLITGAGSAKISGARGSIKFAVESSTGFILYTSTNAVSAVYTGNPRFPFKFREVPGSQGAEGISAITDKANLNKHYIYTTSGIQAINATSATSVLPEVTDFLASGLYESFNSVTQEFDTIALSFTMKKKLTLISSRYLVFSYGPLTYEAAIIYDVVLQRVGRIKIDHVDVFEYEPATGTGLSGQTEPSKQSIGFVSDLGVITLVHYEMITTTLGVLRLAPLKAGGNRLSTLLQVMINNLEFTASARVDDIAYLDGTGETQVNSVTHNQTIDSTIRNYQLVATGNTHSIMIQGNFHVIDVDVIYKTSGRR